MTYLQQIRKQALSINLSQSPGDIKKREVSWTLTKELDAFAGPGEIKRRVVVLDPQVSPEESKIRGWSWA